MRLLRGHSLVHDSKKLNVSARYDGQTMIIKWVVSYIVFAFIFMAAAYAGGGFLCLSDCCSLLFWIHFTGDFFGALHFKPNHIPHRMRWRAVLKSIGKTGTGHITARNRGDYEGALEQVDLLLEKHEATLKDLLKASIEAEDYLDLGTALGTLDEI